jgi:plastocyanin
MSKALGSIVGLALAAALIGGQVAPAAGPPASASAAKTVRIDNFEFTPHKLTVGKGTRVVFSNSSGTAHTATDKGAFDTGRIKTGHAVSVRFGRSGTFAYHCTIHPFMHGKIVVR